MNSSTLWACSIEPGPQTTVLIPISWNNPASVPKDTTSLELSPVKLETNSHASELSIRSKPVTSPIISLVIFELGKTFLISGNKISFAYSSIFWFRKTPSSLMTGLVSHSTRHLSAITLWAIPPNIPPTCNVEKGGSKIESFGALFFNSSLSSINLFAYFDANSTALTPLCGIELCPANPSK